jgi:SAM-dependent methyltransferase
VYHRLWRSFQALAEKDNRVERLTRRVAAAVGYDLTRITRRAYGPACRALIEGLGPANLDAVEISAGENQDWRHLGYRSYRTLDWPDFDLDIEVLPEALRGQFDLVIADQVLEHVRWPLRGVRHMREMLRPGGHALIMTPFLYPIHGHPVDCSRWTNLGLKHLLAEGGFGFDDIEVWSWGNKAVARKLLDGWPRMGWRRELPPDDQRCLIQVWALARRST